jgi:signal transduction histidine kinase/ligand-binding sensor domain-containing protein
MSRTYSLIRRARVLVMWLVLPALPLSSLGQRLALTSYTVKDGLVGQSVKAICQDSSGFIWVSTWTGLSIYDGNKFSNFTTLEGLPHPMVNQVLPFRDNGMWVITNKDSTSLFVHDKLTRFPYKGPCPVINKVEELTPGRYVLATDQGVYEYTGQQFVHLTIEGAPNDHAADQLAVLNDSSFLVVGPDIGMLQLVRRSVHGYRLIDSMPGLFLRDLFRDHTGRIWLAMNDGGIGILDPEAIRHDTIRMERLPAPLEDLRQNVIECLLEDKQHNLWMGTAVGLIKWEPGGHLLRYTIGIDLGTNHINCLFQDREDNIWIGTENGLCKLADPVVTYYDSQEKLPETFLMSIAADADTNLVYLGHLKGLTTINGEGEVSNYLFAAETSGGVIALTVGKPSNWFLRNRYDQQCCLLARFSLNPGKQRPMQLEYKARVRDNTCNALVHDRHGNTFVCGVNGLFVLYGDSVCLFPEWKKFFLTGMIIDSLDHLWLGSFTDSGGIYEFGLEYLPHSIRLHLLHQFQGPMDRSIRCGICDKSGNVWFGTRLNGLLQFTQDKEGHITGRRQWTRKDGLSGDWVKALYFDRDNDLWIGTDASIDLLSTEKGKYQLRNYGKEYNIYGNMAGITQSRDGDIWVAANRTGAIRFTPKKSWDAPPDVVFTRILASGAEDTVLAAAGGGVSLPHDENNIDFEYTAVTYRNERLVEYSYWLEGISKAWSPLTTSHTVHLVSLEPGHYTIKVRARLANGRFSDRIALFNFAVRHAYWQTWWFKCLAAVVVMLSLYGAYRYRIEQLARVHRVRNHLSKDLHDDIGSTLSSINILSGVAAVKMQEGRPEESFSILSRINHYAIEMSEKMSDIVWAINPENESVENLIHRLRRTGSETCAASDIALEFETDEHFKRLSLRMELRKNIYLICKEAMNNAIKHSGCSRITVHLRQAPKGLEIAITDNGHGFDTTNAVKGNGLQNMASRAKEIDAELMIRSASGCTMLNLIVAVP